MTRSEPLNHIVWVNEIAAPVGGCEAYVLKTAKHLSARGVRSTLLYDPGRPVSAEFVRGFDAAFPLVEPAVQLLSIAPDLVYVHRLGGVKATRAIAQGGIPVVRFFHDHRLFCLREHKYTAIGHKTCERPLGAHCLVCPGFIRRAERWPHVAWSSLPGLQKELAANRMFSDFVVGSSYMANHVAEHGFEPRRIHTLPLYAEPPVNDGVVGHEPDLVVFLGQLVRGKGVDVLLDAFARLRTPARLAILGTGRQEQELRQQSARLGLRARVSFLGSADQAAKSEYLRRAAVIAVPSRVPETFALVGPEAMRYGTPVVASRVGGIEEWLCDGVTGLAVPPGDPGALASALDRLVGDVTLATRLGNAGLRAYQERFTPEHHVSSLIALFQEITRKTP